MGNCQAAEAATVVIQHPSGKVDRLYWPTTAEEIMKSNPGHHVAIVTLCIAKQKQSQETTSTSTSTSSGSSTGGGHVRFTRVRLLKPNDMLLVGQVYRLITSHEVNKALRAKKHEKIKRTQAEMMRKQRQQQQQSTAEVYHDSETTAVVCEDQVEQESRSSSTNAHTAAAAAAARLRQWRPSLQSISEGVI